MVIFIETMDLCRVGRIFFNLHISKFPYFAPHETIPTGVEWDWNISGGGGGGGGGHFINIDFFYLSIDK